MGWALVARLVACADGDGRRVVEGVRRGGRIGGARLGKRGRRAVPTADGGVAHEDLAEAAARGLAGEAVTLVERAGAGAGVRAYLARRGARGEVGGRLRRGARRDAAGRDRARVNVA